MGKTRTKRPTPLENLAVVHPNAAGLDIGSREIWASVPPVRAEETVKRFNTLRLRSGQALHP